MPLNRSVTHERDGGNVIAYLVAVKAVVDALRSFLFLAQSRVKLSPPCLRGLIACRSLPSLVCRVSPTRGIHWQSLYGTRVLHLCFLSCHSHDGSVQKGHSHLLNKPTGRETECHLSPLCPVGWECPDEHPHQLPKVTGCGKNANL